MPNANVEEPLPFFERIGLAFKVFFDGTFARRVSTFQPAVAPSSREQKAASPERSSASGLFVLSALQREGRLIDFLRQDVAEFSDADVGAAARVIHGGCRKVLDQYVTIKPVLAEGEGSVVSVPKGYDANRIRVVGNITGEPPYRATLKHQGWEATEIRFPVIAADLDLRVLAPAEVEI